MKVMEGDVIRVRQSTLDACLAPLDAQGYRRNTPYLGRNAESTAQPAFLGTRRLHYERTDAGGAFGGLDEPAFLGMNPYASIPVIDEAGPVTDDRDSVVCYSGCFCRRIVSLTIPNTSDRS
jgi:hypothetical protein